MNINIPRLKRWIAALRSGEFKQGRKALRTGDKYCCLGVLCELHRRATRRRKWCGPSTKMAYDGADAYLPESVAKWLGTTMDDDDVRLTNAVSATHANDEGWSFKRIANALERRYIKKKKK